MCHDARSLLGRGLGAEGLRGGIDGEEDLHLLSPGDGFKWAERAEVVGRRVLKEIPRNEIIYSSSIER